MSSIRRIVASIAATVFLALAGIALATPAYAAPRGAVDDTVDVTFSTVRRTVRNVPGLGGIGDTVSANAVLEATRTSHELLISVINDAV
ncbi:hypothetical protein AB0A70_04225 [Streptomyces morookaense]|uniref:hypothetical protein n=1 Tax=Streptomyces morookaense TaxID=1970 RepID=UPI0033EF33C1